MLLEYDPTEFAEGTPVECGQSWGNLEGLGKHSERTNSGEKLPPTFRPAGPGKGGQHRSFRSEASWWFLGRG